MGKNKKNGNFRDQKTENDLEVEKKKIKILNIQSEMEELHLVLNFVFHEKSFFRKKYFCIFFSLQKNAILYYIDMKFFELCIETIFNVKIKIIIKLSVLFNINIFLYIKPNI